MGLATARIVGRDHRVVISDVDGQRPEDAVTGLKELGVEADGVACDITDQAAVTALLTRAGKLGEVTAVVHTAGLSPRNGLGRHHRPDQGHDRDGPKRLTRGRGGADLGAMEARRRSGRPNDSSRPRSEGIQGQETSAVLDRPDLTWAGGIGRLRVDAARGAGLSDRT